MNKTTMRIISVLTGVILFVVSGYAQITNSALAGKVADKNGEAVAGAVVVATHTPSGTQYHAVTNLEGRYNINGMRAGGPYTVEFSCMGFQNTKFTDVTLALAETYALNSSLVDDTQVLEEAIVISQAASKFSTEKTGAATNINSKQIENLPTVSRSISDITRLSPYGGNGMSFAGSDGRTANFTVDGADFNNNFGLSDKLPGGGNPISIDAIEEMQVVISPYDVRQTNFIGGGVNAITKSGTNTFKGSAYVYHKNEYMRGNNIDRVPVITNAFDKDRTTTYGFTLGGPIVKNKLFFFANFEHSLTPKNLTDFRPSPDGKRDDSKHLVFTSVDDMNRVMEHVKDTYGYDTGVYNDFTAQESNMKVLARLDWNINDQHHLSARYNYTMNNSWSLPNGTSMDGGTRGVAYRCPNDLKQGANSFAFKNATYSMKNLVHTGALDLTSRFSDKVSNQLLATFSKLDDIRGTNSADFPFIDIQDGYGENYMSLGYELFTYNNAVHNTIANVKDNVTLYLGNHKVTAGLSYEYQMADNAYMRNGTGYYRYSSVDDFLSGATPEVVCLTYGYGGEKNPAARVQFHKAGIYAQDEWQAADNFKLTYGLRLDGLFFDNSDLMTNNAILDLKYYPKKYNYTEQHIDTGKWPNASVTVSPRVGFSWDVLGDKSLKVRGGTGLFSGRLPLVFFTNMPTNSGMVQYQAQINAKEAASKGFDMSTFAGGIVTPAEGQSYADALKEKLVALGYPTDIAPDKGTKPSAVNAVDRNFKMPQVWKTSLAIDYAFPTSFPFSISAEGIFNKTVNGVSISDWSIPSVAGFVRFNGVDNRPIYPANFRNGTKAFVLENTNEGYGWSANVTMNMQPVSWISLMAAYTHTVTKEITGMPGSAAESAFTYVPTVEGPNNIRLHNSQYVTPDRVIASATLHDKGNNHYSIIYEAWRGGYNYSYMTTNDMNGDGYNYDAIYIPTDAQVANGEFRFANTTDSKGNVIPAEQHAKNFMDFVHKDKYLSKHQGQYAEGYSVYSPWVHRLDFSYKHDFKITCGKNTNVLQLCFDMKNVLNLFNSSWGVSKILNPEIGSDARILTYEGMDKDGYATYSTPKAINGNTQTFTYNHAIGQCWYASVGIKYMFN